jgi:GntR family transcriptional regulator
VELALRPREDDPAPLYLQLANKLAEAIHAGKWQAGESVPSERALSCELGVSRATARKALDILCQQQLISRRRGSGTFITPRLEQPVSRLTGFTEALKGSGFASSSRWLTRTVDHPTQEEILKLGLSPSSLVARLERLRLANGVVMALEMSVLPQAVLPRPAAVAGSLYDHLDASGQRVVRALQHFRAVRASRRIAHLADVTVGQAMLLVTRIGFRGDNVAIELTDTWCRSSNYDFIAELTR